MDKSKEKFNSKTFDSAMQYARVFKMAQTAELKSNIVDDIKSQLLQVLNIEYKTEQKQIEAHKNAKIESIIDINEVQESSIINTNSVWKKTAENYELKLRQLVQIDAPWEKIEHIAWSYYQLQPSISVAVKIFEICFISGSEIDIQNTLKKLQLENLKFYSHVNKAIRSQLILTNWKTEIGRFLANILVWHKDENWLLPIEKLFILTRLLQSNDPLIPYRFFKLNKAELIKTACAFETQLGIKPSSLYFSAAKIALSLSQEEECKSYLQKIHSQDEEYKEAINLILKIDQNNKKFEQSKYFRALYSETMWENKLILIEKFIKEVRDSRITSPIDISYINQIVKTPLEWIPEDPEAWRKMSKLLVDNFTSIDKLPDIQTLHRKNLLIFHQKSLDLAIWQPFINSYSGPDTYFWQGIAQIHHYIGIQGQNDAPLWQAKNLVFKSIPNWVHHFSWNNIDQSIRNWASQSNLLNDNEKQKIFSHLYMTNDDKIISADGVFQYLKYNQQIALSVIFEIEKLCLDKSLFKPLLEVYSRFSSYAYFTNSKLAKFWKVAIDNHASDTAWRAATILQSRDALNERAIYAWQISGEARKSYSLLNLSSQDISLCTTGFSDLEKRLCFSLLWAGTSINEILYSSQLKQNNSRFEFSKLNESLEKTIDQHINAQPWAHIEPKKTLFGSNVTEILISIPLFAEKIPLNEWSLIFAKIASRLSMDKWDWTISNLSAILDSNSFGLTEFNTHRMMKSNSGKLIKNLSPIQKKSITELKLVSKKISDEKAAFVISVFICRLTTAMFQFHLQALKSLQEMRAPLNILRNLEQWIISADYEKIRNSHKTNIQVPIPQTLKTESIVK